MAAPHHLSSNSSDLESGFECQRNSLELLCSRVQSQRCVLKNKFFFGSKDSEMKREGNVSIIKLRALEVSTKEIWSGMFSAR